MSILRYYQRDAKECVCWGWEESNRQILQLPTGSGKTTVGANVIASMLPGRSLWLADADELCSQPLNTIQRETGIICGLEKAKDHASHSAQVIVGSSQTLSKKKRLEALPRNLFDYILIDECFVAGTSVFGRSIEDIKSGDFVAAFNEETRRTEIKRVLRVFQSIPKSLLRIVIGNSAFVCTPGHPFLTDRGWIAAGLLTKDSSVLSIEEYEKSIPGFGMRILRREDKIHSAEAIQINPRMQAGMLKEMSKFPAFQAKKGIQSNARQGGCSRSLLDRPPGNGLETSNKEGEWTPTNRAPITNSERARLGYGNSRSHQEKKGNWVSNQLQIGCGEQNIENRARDRRRITPLDCTKATGREEGSTAQWVGVESVEILQPTSDGTFGGMCPTGFVYNLHIEDVNTYAVSGIVVHNCHRGTERDIAIASHFDSAKICGLTATPFRQNLADLSKWYDSVAYAMGMQDMVAAGFCPPFKLLNLPVEISVENIKVHAGPNGKDYDAEQVETTILPHFEAIAALVAEHAKDRFGIAFLPLIRSSEAFAAALRRAGISAHHIDGGSPDRKEILRAFEAGEFNWLCNAGVISTGVDIPRADTFLNLRLTQSRAWYQQARGRTARVLPGVIDHLPEENQAQERRSLIAGSSKPFVLIMDLLWQDGGMGVVRGSDDLCETEDDAKAVFEKAKTFKTPQEIADIAKWVQEERESQLVAALERAAIRSDMRTPLSPQELGALLGDSKLVHYQPVSRWEMEAPTENQLAAIAKFGGDPRQCKQRWQASRLMDILVFRAKNGFATVKQVKLMKQMNETASESDQIPNPEKLTLEQAAQMIDREFNRRRHGARSY